MVNCYWIKFELNTKNYFFARTITTNNILLLKICYKNVMKMLRIYHFSKKKKKKKTTKVSSEIQNTALTNARHRPNSHTDIALKQTLFNWTAKTGWPNHKAQ